MLPRRRRDCQMRSKALAVTCVQRLTGMRVLVTRPKERAQELAFLLEDEGATVVTLPLLELSPPDDPRPLAAAAEHVQRYRWVVFASPSGVSGFMEAVREAGTLDRLKRVKVAAVGPKTAQAAKELGLSVDYEAEVNTGRALGERLKAELDSGDTVLLPAAQEGRRELQDALDEAGIEVTRVAAYKSTGAALDSEVVDALRREPPQAIVFGSPRTVESFLETLGEDATRMLAQAKVVTLGPTTAEAVQAKGFQVAQVAARPTSDEVVDAVVRALRP
jgi:uroporphyrinogen-III synthase